MVSFSAALALAAVAGFGQTVLLDFSADWCGPCRSMDPVVKELIAQGYPVRQVNIDRDRALAQKFRVRGIPCFVMLVDGREVTRTEGATNRERLVQMCRMAPAKTGQTPFMLANSNQPPPLAVPAIQSPGPLCPVPRAEQPAPSPEVAVCPPPLAPSQEVAPPRGLKSDAELLAASVRLRIEDPEGRSCGSGTIIDTRLGEALILTCGHIFRDSQGKGRIEVDLFGPSAATRIPGRLISYDLQRDVALVSIRVPGPVVAMPVAPPTYQSEAGEPAVSVGCDQGADPTVRRTRVAAVGKYLGPPNLQVDDVPVIGRSGGGLFTPEGWVIGVCNAADPTVAKGLYAALGSIHSELDRAGLAYLYRNSPVMSPAPLAANNDLAPPQKPMPRPVEIRPTADDSRPAPGNNPPPLSRDEQAMLEELSHRVGDGAEVICIVRPRNNPQSKSEVLMLDRASAGLLERLSAAAVQR